MVWPDGWQPWPDTVFFVEWNWSITDSWPNNISFSTRNLSFETDSLLWLTYIKFPWSSANGFRNGSYKIPCPFTFNVWIRPSSSWWIYWPRLLNNTDSNDNAMYVNMTNNTKVINVPAWDMNWLDTDTWQNLCVTLNSSGEIKMYKNGVLVSTLTWNRTNAANWIICWFKYSNSSDYFSWRMSRVLLEKILWDWDSVAKYVKFTKKMYGLS